MSPKSIHFAAYLLADQVIGALLDGESEGLVLSIDIGGSLFDTVAKNAARSSLHRFVASASLARYRSHVRGRSPQPKPSDIIDEPVLFGRVDGFMRTDDGSEIFETYGPRLDEVATRSIDSWATGRPTLRHVHFGDRALTLDQLAGATKSLTGCRPSLTLYSADLDRQKALTFLNRHDYRVLDLRANQVQPVRSNALADFGWIAFPAEKLARVLSGLSDPGNDGIAQFFEWQEVMERNAPVRQQRSRSVFGLPASAPPLTRKFAASDIVVEDDCYPIESDGISSWRWFGPRPRTRLHLPCVVPGIYHVEITVIASHLRSGLGDCRVLVEGREVRATIHGVESGSIRFIAQLDARNYTGSVMVDVISPGTVSAVGTDPRALRLNIQSVAVSPWR